MCIPICGMCLCTDVCSRKFMCLVACCNDMDPLQDIRICTRYGPDTLAIRRPIHGMIWRSIPLRALKTRRRFGSKTASFHVSVCSRVIFLFTVVIGYLCFTYIISCDHLLYFTSMIAYIISCDISECSLYLCC